MTIPEPDGAELHGSEPSANGATPPEPGAGTSRVAPPVPLVLSCIAGAAGTVLLVAGAATANTAMSIGGVVAGSLSLGAALYWRSLLISSWAAQKRDQPPR